MSSKMQFQVFYGDYNVMYGPNGVDLSAFKCTSSSIDKPLERSFGFICKWLQRASTRSQVATTQHGDHGFPKCRILCPDIRDPITVPFHHFKKM